MGQETMGKREREKKKRQKKQEKLEKKQERKENNNKGKSLDDMIAYIDENGNLSETPPDPKNKQEIAVEDIILGAGPTVEQEVTRKGVIKFFNDEKGYGFITDLKNQDSIFVHINELEEPVKERDKVTFELGRGPKGIIAVNVKKAS